MRPLEGHAALAALADLAKELNLPPSSGDALGAQPRFDEHAQLALQLCRFLIVKRHVSEVSPSGLIDELWHAMLLQTEVRDAVHAMLGSDVPHSLLDDTRLSDEAKLERRLRAILLMSCEGWEVTPEFWEVPGTVMHSMQRVDASFWAESGLKQPLPFLVPRNCSRAWARAHLPSLLKEVVGPSRESGWVAAFIAALEAVQPSQPHAPTPVGTPDLRSANASGRALRQRRLETMAVPAEAAKSPFAVWVETLYGKHFEVELADGADALVVELKQRIKDLDGIPGWQQRLIYAGEQLEDERPLSAYGIGRHSTVHMVLKLRGC